MNYIEKIMKKNKITINQKFALVGGQKYNENDKIFYFNKNYNLTSDTCGWGKEHIYHSSMLIKLLTGEYKISL